ncbi:hypothetical protein ACSHT0_14195 [Tepidicaulis sp. LMO-SS28]|uniref:hypothetical protein n=1 Tax=Tepidicaulis sp. LMO-SS28 TaxID=3447455 RepID=UPI003EDEEF81
MAKIGLIEKFNRELVRERGATTEVGRTKEALEQHEARKAILGLVREAGKSGDLETILTVERRFLENDRAEYANSRAMRSSLDVALGELKVAERHLELVNDPAQYKLIDEAHSLPKRRVGGLPKDEARLFFGSHATRLLNQDKSRLDQDEKKIIDARKQNMRAAAKLYETRQRQALGLGAETARKRGRDQGMEL